MKLYIEYCERWNYKPQFEQLAQSLKNEFLDIEVLGNQDGEFRVCSFELTMGDKEIFSKLESGRFPTDEEIIDLIKNLLWGLSPYL